MAGAMQSAENDASKSPFMFLEQVDTDVAQLIGHTLQSTFEVHQRARRLKTKCLRRH
jgi:hypothetical protein